MLAALFNIFNTGPTMHVFSFHNADAHFRQNQAVAQQFNVQLPYYTLDPIPSGAGLVNWLQLHQNIHSLTNDVLSVVGNDLSDVDFRDPDQVASWVWLHAQEHRQQMLKLGIQQ
jgi:hypothetical protein